MKKLFSILVLLSLSLMPTSGAASKVDAGNNRIVYICTGPNSKAYHYDKDCKGLNKCSRSIKAVRLSNVQSSRRPCKICVE